MAADPILVLRKQAIAAIKTRLARLAEQYGDEPMTQTELAEMLGLTRSRLNLLLREKATEFTLEALLRIALSADLSVRLKLTRPYNSD